MAKKCVKFGRSKTGKKVCRKFSVTKKK